MLILSPQLVNSKEHGDGLSRTKNSAVPDIIFGSLGKIGLRGGKDMARKRRKWTHEDRQFLTENYRKMSNAESGKHFGHAAGIAYQLERLGLKRGGRWTEEKDNFLRHNYMEMTNKELAVKLEKTVCAIEKRLGTLELRRLKRWTPEREQFLRANYEIMSNAFLARKLDARELASTLKMSPDYIRNKISELGIR
jgi:hypothetical protein